MARHVNGGANPPVDMVGVAPVSVRRLSDEVAASIRAFIIEQDLKEGTRLPAERALAELFGASRPTVSQAIRTLSLMGLVETRRGSGAYVVRRPDKSVTAPIEQMLDVTEDNLEHLVQLRLWLETLGVGQAIENRSDDGIAQAKAALEHLAQSMGETSRWMAADTVFHATLVGLAGNPFLTSIYESVHTKLISYEYQHWVENDRVPRWLEPSESAAQLALHAPIVEAIERADPGAAVTAVRVHNDVMREHLMSREG